MQILTITECQPLYLHLNHTYFMICLWTSRLPFAKFTATKAISAITTKGSICHHVPCSISFLLFFFFNEGDNALSCCALLKCIFSDLQLKETSILLPLLEWSPYSALGWMGTRSFSNRGCLCCQSKAEQWLRLISILMNANWHICYGGLAVQTLQLAWLINYPPAGGSLEMESGERMGAE